MQGLPGPPGPLDATAQGGQNHDLAFLTKRPRRPVAVSCGVGCGLARGGSPSGPGGGSGPARLRGRSPSPSGPAVGPPLAAPGPPPRLRALLRQKAVGPRPGRSPPRPFIASPSRLRAGRGRCGPAALVGGPPLRSGPAWAAVPALRVGPPRAPRPPAPRAGVPPASGGLAVVPHSGGRAPGSLRPLPGPPARLPPGGLGGAAPPRGAGPGGGA